MTFEPGPRPPARWGHAATFLDHFALITYRVDLDALAARLPEGVTPDRFTFADGAEQALVSAVPFLDRDFHFRALPLVKASCGQINYRAYVHVGDQRGVWFFGTSLDSVFVALPRYVWSMPWHRDRIAITGAWDGAGPARIELEASGPWGPAAHELVEPERAPGGEPTELTGLDGFGCLDEVHRVLTDPVHGWYRRRDGRIGHYSVWHPALDLHPWIVRRAWFPVLERLGLIGPDTEPHSALVQRTVAFDVHTPPDRLA